MATSRAGARLPASFPESTNGAGSAVVRERFSLTFQSGEIRLGASCHGLNSVDRAGHGAPQNEPEALRTSLQWYKTILFRDEFEAGNVSSWSP